MKFFILNHYAYAPDQSAGTRHYELARQIEKEGHEALIISCSFFHKTHSKRKGTKWKFYQKEKIQGVNYLWVWGSPYKKNGITRILNLVSFTFLSVLYLCFKGKKGSILFASSPQPLAPFFSFLLGGKRFFKVFEVRDFWPQVFIDMGELSGKSRLAKSLFNIERYLISQSDLFVSNLRAADRYCKDKGISYKEFLWVPNGVRKVEKNTVKPAVIEGEEDSLKVIYTGAHGEAQNLTEVIKAAETLFNNNKKIEFHFLGDGVEKANLKEYVRQKDLKNCFFYEPVKKNEVKSYIASADVLLLPLVDAKVFSYGISPNKLPEYLASGKPIIYFGPKSASPFEFGTEAITSNGTESQDLVNAIERYLLMTDSQKLEMSMTSKALLESRFLVGESMGRLVRKVLNGRK